MQKLNKLSFTTILSSSLLSLGFVLLIFKWYGVTPGRNLFQWKYVAPMVIIQIVLSFLSAVIYYLPFRNSFLKLPIKEWYGLSIVSNLYNLVLPAKVGGIFKIHYLKKHHYLSFKEAFRLNSMAFAVALFSLGSFGVLLNSYTESSVIFKAIDEYLYYINIIAILTFYIAFSHFKKNHKAGTDWINKTILQVTITFVVLLAFVILKTYILFYMLGHNLSVIACIELSFFLSILSVVQILPSNIGIKEVVYIYISRKFGIPVELALVASLIDRVSLTSLLIPSGIYFYLSVYLKGPANKEASPGPIYAKSPTF